MTYALIILASGFLSASVAASKGRSPIGWFLLGCFVPVLSLIALVGLPSRRDAEIDQRDLKTCPQCAETVKRAAKVCRHCGHAFSADSYVIPAHLVAKKTYRDITYELFDDRHVEAEIDGKRYSWRNTNDFRLEVEFMHKATAKARA